MAYKESGRSIYYRKIRGSSVSCRSYHKHVGRFPHVRSSGSTLTLVSAAGPVGMFGKSADFSSAIAWVSLQLFDAENRAGSRSSPIFFPRALWREPELFISVLDVPLNSSASLLYRPIVAVGDHGARHPTEHALDHVKE